MMDNPLAAGVPLFSLGPVPVTATVVTTWGLMALLTVGAWLATRRLAVRPGRGQVVLELLVTGIADQIEAAIHRDPHPYLPLIGTLFLFIATANLSGEIPGVEAPTGRLETTAALAGVVFLSTHVMGVRALGLGAYLRRYLRPTVVMLPFNLLSEFTRTLALAVRLFGNVMSHGFIVAVVLGLAGLLVPIPIMALGLLIGLVQAYIFAVLATVFVGAAVGAIEAH
ncbi:MAG: F0F1 ATP synthase subunit A [Alphaproteobacteria bacterium]